MAPPKGGTSGRRYVRYRGTHTVNRHRAITLARLVLLCTALGACKTTGDAARLKSQAAAMDDGGFAPIEPTAMTDEEKRMFFRGCQPSVGDCFNSCPSHKYLPERNEKACPSPDDGPWQCYCKD